MQASEYIVEYLLKNNITKVYGYIGGMIAYLVDSIYVSKDIEMVNTITEQGAAFAAEGAARVSGKTTVAIATSGPGATNLITGIGSCFYDSVPVLFITGQVNTNECKVNVPIRQRGFQETDIVSLVRPITKYAVLVDDIKNLRYELEKSIFLTQNGRKGPVLLDIPINIQYAKSNFLKEKSFFNSNEYKALVKESKYQVDCTSFISLLGRAKKPLVLVGGGVRTANSVAKLEEFLIKSQIPVVKSLMGIDCICEKYKYNMGLIGSYGNRCGNYVLADSDLLLVLGSRLDSRQIGAVNDKFICRRQIVRIDIDVNELKFSRIKSNKEYCCDLKDFLVGLLKYKVHPAIDLWQTKVLEYKNIYPSYKTVEGDVKFPNYFIYILSQKLKKTDIVVVDVGQHQMWVAQSLMIKFGQRVLFSGGMGAMGFALPAAIGCCFVSNNRVIVISGDGGMQMNIQELEVLKRRNLRIKIIIMNNFCLGMVRQFQNNYLESRYASTVEDYSVPNFVKIAQAYGIRALNVNINDEWEHQLDKFLKSESYGIFNLLLNMDTKVEPKLRV